MGLMARQFLIGIVFVAGLLGSSLCFADAQWRCAKGKSDISPGYYVQEIAKDLKTCPIPKQLMMIQKITASSFWMCSVENVGAPPGYSINQVSKVSSCGCREPMSRPNGEPFCASEVNGKLPGWPLISVNKLP